MSEDPTIINKPGIVVDKTVIIPGDVLVVAGGYLTLHGTVTGFLEIAHGGEVHISGGVVKGCLTNAGGTLWINHGGTVLGWLRSCGHLYIHDDLIGPCATAMNDQDSAGRDSGS